MFTELINDGKTTQRWDRTTAVKCLEETTLGHATRGDSWEHDTVTVTERTPSRQV